MGIWCAESFWGLWCRSFFYYFILWSGGDASGGHHPGRLSLSSSIAAADAAKEAAFLKNLFLEMRLQAPRAVPLKCDNQSTIKQSLNQVDQRRCRHMGMRTHFLRQQCHSGNLRLEYIPSSEQLGDAYTKCLYTPQHLKIT